MTLYRCRDCGTYFNQDETYEDNDGEKCPRCLSQSWEEVYDGDKDYDRFGNEIEE